MPSARLTLLGTLLRTLLLARADFGYHGGKSVAFYIGGIFVGGYFVSPLWWLYRWRYAKPASRA